MTNAKWVGVDCHKDFLACYTGSKFKKFSTLPSDFNAALEWAGKNSKWAIEGAYCFGRAFTSYLNQNGCEVYEVNPLLTKTWRQGYAVNGTKNDAGDAKVIATLANNFKLQPVSLATIKLKELLTTRRFYVKQRTSIICHIRMLFNVRGESLPMKDLTTKKAMHYFINHSDRLINGLGRQLQELSKEIDHLDKEIEKELPEKASELTKLTGVKTITATTLYTELKGKKLKKEELASYAGVAPVENSSGKRNFHRNNKGGNRILNSIFYQMSIHQSIHDEKGKLYYEKKLSEGKSPRHARKCLARQLVNIVWKIINH